MALSGIGSEKDLGAGPPEEQTFWHDVILTRRECRSEKALRLADYWESLRRGRSVPSRKDIDPTELGPLLAHVHLSEWYSNPDRVRYRLAGTEVVAAIGREISGHWLTDFHTDPKDIEETLTLYRYVAAERRPVFGRTTETLLRIGTQAFDWVICPLSDDDGAITHFIGLEDYVARRRYLGGAA